MKSSQPQLILLTDSGTMLKKKPCNPENKWLIIIQQGNNMYLYARVCIILYLLRRSLEGPMKRRVSFGIGVVYIYVCPKKQLDDSFISSLQVLKSC